MLSESQLRTLFYVLLLTVFAKQVGSRRRGKALLFPPTAPTRAQLIYGIGIPLPLEYESMTTGYVLKAEYFLPTTAAQFRPLQITPQPVAKRHVSSNITRHADDYDDDSTLRYIRNVKDEHKENGNAGKYRWAVYRVVETIAARMGLDGRACMLRAICEAAEAPFHYSSGLLGELLHIIMTPSSSVDPLSKHSDNEYLHAEFLGKSGAPCDVVFKECARSLLSIFSGTYSPFNSITRMLG